MVKVRGPLFSLGASGTLGRAISYRRQVFGAQVEKKPQKRDLKSGAQVTRRGLFLEAVAHWNGLSSEEKAAYRTLAAVLPMTGFNLCVQDYLMGRIEVGIDVQEGGDEKVAAATVLDFTAADFAVTDEGDKKAGIALDYTASKIARKDQDETVTGKWMFNTPVAVNVVRDTTYSLKVGFPAEAAVMTAVGGFATASLSAARTRMSGLSFAAILASAEGVGELNALRVQAGLFNFSGTVTDFHGLLVEVGYHYLSGSDTVTRAHGLRIRNQGYLFLGAMDKVFGLLIEPQTGATEKYSIWAGAPYDGTPLLRLDEGTPAAGKTGLVLNVAGTLYRLVKDVNDFVKMEAV